MNRENKYWRNRANLRMADYHSNGDEYIALIVNAYDKAIKDINDEISKMFNAFMISGKLNISEAKDLLNSYISDKELDSIRSKINQIQDEDIKAYLMAQLNMKAYKARITRLEALKESIYINSKLIADTELRQSTLSYINSINDAYYRNIFDIQKGTGLGFDFATMPVN